MVWYWGKVLCISLRENPHIEVCKVKGITLSFETSKKINLSAIKDLLTAPQDSHIEVTTKNSIRRQKETKRIKACDVTKSFRITNDKRVKVVGSYITLPYGHKDIP